MCRLLTKLCASDTAVAFGGLYKPKDIAIWEKAVRAQATLATPLRLAPQARTDPKTIACQQPYRGPCPWEGLEDLDRNGNRRRDA